LHHNNPAFDTADQNAITAYEALHPEIHFVTQTGTFTDLGEELQTLLPTNSIDADIITIPPAQTCAFTKYLNPVPSDVMTTDQASALFFAAPLEGSTCGGQLMAIPIEYNMEYGGIVVNMDLYGGTTVPTWTNIDDMFTDVASHVLSAPADYCASATNPASCLRGTTGMSFLQADPLRNVFLAGILQRGGQIWSGSALNFASAEAQASIQWIWEKAWISMDNAAVHCSNSVDDVDPILSTTNQRDVSRYCGTWLIPAVQANYPNLNLAYTTHPPLVGTEHKFVTNAGWSYAVPKTSTHAAEAWDFIKYLTTNQAQALAWSKTTGTIPALSANANDPGLLASTAGLAAIVPLLPLGHWLGYLPDVNKVFTTIFYARLYPLFCNDPTGADPAYATDAQRQAAVAVVANQIQSDLNALGWW
jgi:multiple sugar transport system substrate-binding protein